MIIVTAAMSLIVMNIVTAAGSYSHDQF